MRPKPQLINRRAHMKASLSPVSRLVFWSIVLLTACQDPSRPTGVPTQAVSADHNETANVITIDHGVPHVSTVAANAGERVQLFLRERVRGDITNRPREAILMIHGRSVPVLAA